MCQCCKDESIEVGWRCVDGLSLRPRNNGLSYDLLLSQTCVFMMSYIRQPSDPILTKWSRTVNHVVNDDSNAASDVANQTATKALLLDDTFKFGITLSLLFGWMGKRLAKRVKMCNDRTKSQGRSFKNHGIASPYTPLTVERRVRHMPVLSKDKG